MCGAEIGFDVNPKAVIGNDSMDGTNVPILNHLADLNAEGEVAGPNCFHKEEVLRLGCLDELGCLGGIDGKRFFAEDVLAC